MGRFFEVADKWKKVDIELPKRSTKKSAGYDFYTAEDVSIVPIWRSVIHNLTIKPQKVHTGIKVSMEDDEVLLVYNRSSNPIKRLLNLANGVGVIDADYYDTGEDISFDFWNFGLFPQHIDKGTKIGQGVFQKFLKVDAEKPVLTKRTGGNGSTDVE
jgi:dUTP pyrophosphatase